MCTGRNASGCGGCSTAGSDESAGHSCECEMRGVWHASDGKRAVVTGNTDAAGGDQLAGDETVRPSGLNRCGCGGCRAAT